MRRTVGVVAMALLVASCGGDDGTAPVPTSSGPTPTPTQESVETGLTSPWPAPLGDAHQEWTVRVVDRVPHDPTAFTQGLEFTDAGLLESTGRRGASSLRLLDPTTGEILVQVDNLDEHFGEGVAVRDGIAVQLTWQSGVALRWDAELAPVGEFAYEGEGWGLCHDGADFWMSDGSATLTRRDSETFAPLATVTVRRDGEPVGLLNELECIGDRVAANVWWSDEIVVIDPATGVVGATIDAAALADEIASPDTTAVLNGIADPGDGTLVLGGKLWPTLFVVEIVG
ncbi:MAG: glutaminyl-peptide cyclotransferase [Acidimicrobiales bacterium]|nr:glutaminyl-peptide cyclotransferase [Acidimicrobiales bacterium]